MRLFALCISLIVIIAVGLMGQSKVGGKTIIGGGSLISGSPGGVVSVTVNLGGTAVTTNNTDTGNGLVVFWDSFITPASMTSPLWGSTCSAGYGSHDAANNTGCALYADTTTTGTVNTFNVTTGSCTVTGNTKGCVVQTGGTAFDTGCGSSCWNGGNIVINGVNWTITTINDSTHLGITRAPGSQTGVNYTVHSPGSFICRSTPTAPNADGFISYSFGESCAVPTTSTMYWIAEATASATQNMWNNQVENGGTGGISPGWCPDGYWPYFSSTKMSAFTSISNWPASGSAGGAAADSGDGCPGVYVPLVYSTTSYALNLLGGINCDQGGVATCDIHIPALAGNMNLIVLSTIGSASSQTISSVVTKTSGTTTDTLTKRGACTQITGGGISAPTQQCFFSIDRATSGADQITCTFSSSTIKAACWMMAWANTASTSFDQNCYDSAIVGSLPFGASSCTVTTGQQELLIGSVMDASLQTCCPYNGPTFAPSGNWNLLFTGATAGGNSPEMLGLAYQVAASGTYHLSGNENGPSGSPQMMTAVSTYK